MTKRRGIEPTTQAGRARTPSASTATRWYRWRGPAGALRSRSRRSRPSPQTHKHKTGPKSPNPSLPTSRETLTTQESMNPEGENGARDVVDRERRARPAAPPRPGAGRAPSFDLTGSAGRSLSMSLERSGTRTGRDDWLGRERRRRAAQGRHRARIGPHGCSFRVLAALASAARLRAKMA